MSLIQASAHDRILHLKFEDLSSRNSFSIRAAEELSTHLRSQIDKIDGVVFSSFGRVFCSGGNLTDYAGMTDPEQGKAVNRRITDVLHELARLPRPTVCVVTGDCYGGGIELMSAFDVVLSAPHVVFGFWQRRIGLSFGWGGGARIESRIGTHHLKRYALAAANLQAREAQSVGLIDCLLPEPLLMNEAEKRVRAMAALPSAPVRAVKAWESDREAEFFESLWWNDEHQQVLQSRR